MPDDAQLNAEIYGDATPDQIAAIDHIGSHARLLAGPGTGKTKTLTRRVLSLILRHGIDPASILLLTFTRLAAAQLREEIKAVLVPHNKAIPEILTLHSFALKQILHNARIADVFPRPIRIADDWEERFIIQEDLKTTLGINIDAVQTLLHQLSADWETLRAEEPGWEQQFPNAAFLGAWRQHKDRYGETLRSELVYQLKRLLNQNREFTLDKNYRHILIDEYQDLNACDLAVIHELANRGAELFVAGDDDQSIYGFRYASPAGIRQFPQIYAGSQRLALEICFRCDKEILRHAEFVANLDPVRLPKPTRPRDGAADGVVKLVNCLDQDEENRYIVKVIKERMAAGVLADKICILVRSDRNSAISRPMSEALRRENINVSLALNVALYNHTDFRRVLSYIRLVVNSDDSLSLRSLIQVENNGCGAGAIKAIWSLAQERGVKFSQIARTIKDNPALVQRFGARIAEYVRAVDAKIDAYKAIGEMGTLIMTVINDIVTTEPIKTEIIDFFRKLVGETAPANLDALLRAVGTFSDELEQETDDQAVKLLTMHQAKGLTFDTCIIAAAEDEYIPGKNEGEYIGDERRLLYVSMTRAKHNLYITYCSRRTGQQRHTGRTSGQESRSLTRFLRDSALRAIRP